MTLVDNLRDDFDVLHKELGEALALINQRNSNKQYSTVNQGELKLHEAQSLLEQCKRVVDQQKQKPILRIVHHLACSGGTLVSKCLSALPNVFLLSELHPTTTLHQGGGKPKFLPADVITQSRYAGVPDADTLAWDIFKANIVTTSRHLERFSGKLVIRDHTHSDFCVGESYSNYSTIANALSTEFELLRVVTLRDPIDAYLSLVKNGWASHFQPTTFDEYCKRVWAFVSEYSDEQVYKYEDFVCSPETVLNQICTKLRLEFEDSFQDIFDIFQVTGDSGRSGDVISPRERRPLTDEEVQEFANSDFYTLIAKRFNYNSLDKE